MKKKRKLHKGTNRPVWNGPEKDCYYYMVRNKRHTEMAAWVVLFSDEYDVRQIAAVHGGHWSLIESDIELPIKSSEGSLLSHEKVEQVKRKLFESHDRKIREGNDTTLTKIDGIPIMEDEVFG